MNLPRFSFAIFFPLLAIIAAGGTIFHILTRRWTHDRRRAGMEDWANDNRFHFRRAPRATLPAALESLKLLDARVDAAFTRGPITILQLVTVSQPNSRQLRWHVLLRELDQAWTPAGLRPIKPEKSFVDLFSLTSFPALLPPERFVVYAADARTAKQMAHSSARGLLPPDVGLIVHGPYVTLDFSQRPFDTIEFDRMLAVMEQLVAHLPAQA